MKGKLLIENYTTDNIELKNDFRHTIVESTKGTKSFRVTGPMIVCEKKNKNGRTYTKESMLVEVAKFNELCSKNHLSTRVGMDHPATAELPLKETAGRILEIYESKNNPNVFCGEVEIFAETPYGSTIVALVERGMYPGFSTRALGSIDQSGIVNEMNLISVDLVSDPSAEVYVEQICESKTYEYTNGLLRECTEEVKEVIIETNEKDDNMLLTQFESVLNSVEYFTEAELVVKPELKRFFNTLVEVNGLDKAKAMIQKIIDGRVSTFNGDLQKIGLVPGEKKTSLILKNLIA